MRKHFGFLVLLTSIFWLQNTLAQEMDYNLDKHKMLIENKGQWDDRILFQSKFQGGNLWVQQHKLLFHLQDYSEYQAAHANFSYQSPNAGTFRQSVLHANFVGSNEVKEIEKELPSIHYYNYFLGNEPSKWANDVHSFHKANLKNLYDGIDLQIIQTADEMKYEFHVAPNVNPDIIKIQYAGQKSLKLDGKGNLIIETDLGTIMEKKPYVYQIINGRIKEISCDFNIERNTVSFDLGNYQKDIELVIDPILVFATYCGSVTDNFGMTATYGQDGSAYSGGMIYGNTYPTPDNLAFDISSNFTVISGDYGITDVFISKYNSTGTQMLWTTFLGGGNNTVGTETAQSMIADQNDNLYVYGTTSSVDFPIVNGYQATNFGGTPGVNFTANGVYFTNHGTDIYVAKISANGHNLLGSTFFGGSDNEGVNYNTVVSSYGGLVNNYGDQFRGEIMLDNVGNVLVGSNTRSTDFPVTSTAIQSSNGGQQDGVLFKLSNDLSTRLYSTYYGGLENDAIYSVKIDSVYNIVFAGGTKSLNLAGTTGKYQPAFQGGSADGFIGKLNTSGSTLLGSTYIGTSNYDQVYFLEIDRTNKIFVTGQSPGGIFPVVNSSYSVPFSNNFIAKLDANLLGIERSTVYGRSTSNTMLSPSAFLVDRCGEIYVSGWGSALVPSSVPLLSYPTTSDALLQTSTSTTDFHLFVLDRNFNAIKYGSYIGGALASEHVDGGTSRFDRNGIVYQSVCGGCGGNSDFQTTAGAWSNLNLSSNCNNLVFKFDFQTLTESDFTVSDTAACFNQPITLTNNSSTSPYGNYYWILPNGDTSTLFHPTLTFPGPGNYVVQLIVTDSVCNQSDTSQISISIAPALQLAVSNDTTVCVAENIVLTANSFGTSDSFVWSSNGSFSDTLNDSPMDSVIVVNPVGTQTYYVKVENENCSQIDSVKILILSNSILLSDTSGYCEGETENIVVTELLPGLNFQYQWSPDSILIGPANTNSVNTSTLVDQYLFVTVNAGLGCVFKDSVWLNVHNLSTIAVSASANPSSVPIDGTTTLSAMPAGLSYSWTPTKGLASPNSQSTQATVNKDTEYTVLFSDGYCSNTAKVKVSVFEYSCDAPYVFVPNAFSPNADLENDVLYVRSQILAEILFRVFNRWGEMVFETTDASIGWDGTFNGKMMDPDVYDYYLKAVCIDGQENIIKGNVTLLR